MVQYNKEICDNIIIIALYRSPTGNFKMFLDKLEYMLTELMKDHKNIAITGDFNIDFNGTSNELKNLNIIINSLNVKSAIKEPTRISKTSATTIDNILTNIDEKDFTTVVYENGISDHKAQMIKINISCIKLGTQYKNKSNPAIMYRAINDEKVELFNKLLACENWEFLNDNRDINYNFNKFIETFINLYHTAFPIVKAKSKDKAIKTNNWITDEVRRSSVELKNKFEETKLVNGQDKLQEYKALKKSHRRKVRRAKETFNTRLVKSAANKPKKIWDIVKKETRKHDLEQKENVVLLLDDKLTEEPLVVANAFNEYYLNIPNEIKSSIKISEDEQKQYKNSIPSKNKSIFLYPATRSEIINTTMNLKNNQSTGIEGIKVSIIKQTINSFVHILLILIN